MVHEWAAVGTAAPLLLFPTVRPRWTVVALALVAGWWVLRWAVRGEPWPLTPFNGALLLFVLMIPVGMWVSAFPDVSVPEGVRLLLGLAVFRVVAQATRRRPLVLAVAAFCLLGLSIAMVGALAAQWSTKVPALAQVAFSIPRLISTVPEDQGPPGANPNHLAGALMLFLPLAGVLVFKWPYGRGVSARMFLVLAGCTVVFGLMGAVWVLTQSRSGWVGGTAGFLTVVSLAGLTASSHRARLVGAVLPLLVVTLLAVSLVHFGPQWVGETLYQYRSQTRAAEQLTPVEGVVGEITMAGRIQIWNRALLLIRDFPFTGCGIGAFRRVMPLLYPLFETASPSETDVGHAHNVFLQTALDLGVPGLVAYLALLIVALALCWQQVQDEDKVVHTVALGLAGGLVAFHVYGLTDAVALGSKPAVALWYTLGLTAALGESRKGKGQNHD